MELWAPLENLNQSSVEHCTREVILSRMIVNDPVPSKVSSTMPKRVHLLRQDYRTHVYRQAKFRAQKNDKVANKQG